MGHPIEGSRRRGPRSAWSTRHQRGALFRMVLLTSVFVAVVARGWVEPEHVATVTWSSGELRVDERRLGPGLESVRVDAGGWLATFADGRATLADAALRAEVAPDSRVAVEALAPLRLRLQRGVLELEGDGVVTTPYGLVRVEGGAARVACRAGALDVVAHRGAVEVVDAGGARALAPASAAAAP